MNAPAEPDGQEPEPDPRDLFVDAAREKLERRRRLDVALAGGDPPEPAAGESARDRLAELLGAERLAAVDERLLEQLLAEGETADARDVVTAARAAKGQGRAALADALRGRRPQPPEDEPRGSISFDGGARESLPRPPPTHEQQLIEVVRGRKADRGEAFRF